MARKGCARMKAMDVVDQAVQDIKNLKIQGAMAVAGASLKAIREVRKEDLEKRGRKTGSGSAN